MSDSNHKSFKAVQLICMLLSRIYWMPSADFSAKKKKKHSMAKILQVIWESFLDGNVVTVIPKNSITNFNPYNALL